MTPELERLIKEFEHATQDYALALERCQGMDEAGLKRHQTYSKLCRAIEDKK